LSKENDISCIHSAIALAVAGGSVVISSQSGWCRLNSPAIIVGYESGRSNSFSLCPVECAPILPDGGLYKFMTSIGLWGRCWDFDDHHVVVKAYVISRYNNYVVPLAGVGHHPGDSVRW